MGCHGKCPGCGVCLEDGGGDECTNCRKPLVNEFDEIASFRWAVSEPDEPHF